MDKTYDLTFTVKIGSQARVVIPTNIIKQAELKRGDLITLKLTNTHRKGETS